MMVDMLFNFFVITYNDIKELPSDAFSLILQIGDKVIKVGRERVAPKLLRKEFKIDEENSIFIEVNERLDINYQITEEELYQLYKKVRQLVLICIDVAFRNIGILLKDNKIHWRQKLPLTDEVLGLEKYRWSKIMLKKGDIVICDNDIIYDENDDKDRIREYSPPQCKRSLNKDIKKRNCVIMQNGYNKCTRNWG